MNPVLLIIYFVGAICTARCLSVPSIGCEQRPFVVTCSVLWPITVTVFGLLGLLALLGHLYDMLTVALKGQTESEADAIKRATARGNK